MGCGVIYEKVTCLEAACFESGQAREERTLIELQLSAFAGIVLKSIIGWVLIDRAYFVTILKFTPLTTPVSILYILSILELGDHFAYFLS